MKIRVLHPWDVGIQEAIQLQIDLAHRAARVPLFTGKIRTIAGADIAYDIRRDRIWAAVVVLAYPSLELVDQVVDTCRVHFPYIPGLFSFREAPPILGCLERLARRPDALLVDAHGMAHPRRFGLACHLGLLASIPTIGCAKSRLIGSHGELGTSRGSQAGIYYDNSKVGTALRTRSGVRPVYVSSGYRLSLRRAVSVVLRCAPRHRIPEPLRAADSLANASRRRRSIDVGPWQRAR